MRKKGIGIKIELWNDFLPFYQAMNDELFRHHPERGFGYRDKTWIIEDEEELDAVDGFHAEIIRAFDEWRKTKEPSQLVDIANLMAMSWLHEENKLEAS